MFSNSNLKVIEGLDLVVQSMYKNELAIISIKVNNRSLDIRQSQLRTKQAKFENIFAAAPCLRRPGQEAGHPERLSDHLPLWAASL